MEKQTYGFETEVKQLLDLVVHSLYSHKEIFLRELISNASDAVDRLRFEVLSKPDLIADDPDMKIYVEFDAKAKTITVKDNGIGMSRDDVIAHLGTIAHSGTRKFVESLTGDKTHDSQMIGQFGVGFYSSFMVADKVVVITRRADLKADEAVRWESSGTGEYTVEDVTKETRGTDVILHIKDDEKEFLDNWKLRSIVKKYSDHISLPIYMIKENTDDKKKKKEVEFEAINQGQALWVRSKADIKDEEYKEFYKHISYDYMDPACWIHNKVEGKTEYTGLFYIPAHAPFDLWERERKSGVKLYIQRVFIMDNADILPSYLRFVKGVIDSSDLPLNVSREILQHNKVINKIRTGSVNKILGMLENMAENDTAEYAKIWKEFGKVLKEAPGDEMQDNELKERIAKLYRFASTHTDEIEQNVSLDDYIARMKEGQKHIYYVIAESFAAAKNNPHLEIFRKKGIEVLLLSDRVDEWMTTHLPEYAGKQLKSVSKGELDLGDLADKEEKKAKKQEEKEYKSIIEQMKKVLGDSVSEVRTTDRLTDSPACIVVDDNGMSMHLQQIMMATGQSMPMPKPILELNPEHRLIMQLKEVQDEERFADLTHLLFDQSMLAEGCQLEDPASFVKRMNKFL